jgi:hypothetical protein
MAVGLSAGNRGTEHACLQSIAATWSPLGRNGESRTERRIEAGELAASARHTLRYNGLRSGGRTTRTTKNCGYGRIRQMKQIRTISDLRPFPLYLGLFCCSFRLTSCFLWQFFFFPTSEEGQNKHENARKGRPLSPPPSSVSVPSAASVRIRNSKGPIPNRRSIGLPHRTRRNWDPFCPVYSRSQTMPCALGRGAHGSTS